MNTQFLSAHARRGGVLISLSDWSRLGSDDNDEAARSREIKNKETSERERDADVLSKKLRSNEVAFHGVRDNSPR